MEKAKAIELLKMAVPQDESLDEEGLFIEAVNMAIEALEKAPTALDHIHNVVAEREYQRGYEQAKEEYDHKLTEIKSRFKDRYYSKGYDAGHNEGYERGRKDAATSLAIRITTKYDEVLGVDDVLEEIDNL